MAFSPIATPLLLTDPGVLFWAPLGSSVPTHTVSGSVFTDSWPVAWVPLGATDGGTTITASLTVEEIDAAEFIDPLAYRTTGRTFNVAMTLKNFTAANLARTLNTSASTVSGSGATLITKVSPPNPGSEVRAMIGFESLDSTTRWIAYQVINSGDVAVAFQKSPTVAMLPWTANCEKPSSTQPVDWWFAGSSRTGS
jgi:hypothetical protein